MTQDRRTGLFAEPRRRRHGQAEFERFDRENPQVWALFERFAMVAARRRQRGVTIGARLIWEKMRWETTIETFDPQFKLNDHWAPFFARKFMARHPEFGKVFEVRERRSTAK